MMMMMMMILLQVSLRCTFIEAMPCQSMMLPPGCFFCFPRLPVGAGTVLLIWHVDLTSKAFSLDSSTILQPPHPHPHLHRSSRSARRGRGGLMRRLEFFLFESGCLMFNLSGSQFVCFHIQSCDWSERTAEQAPGSSLLHGCSSRVTSRFTANAVRGEMCVESSVTVLCCLCGNIWLFAIWYY